MEMSSHGIQLLKSWEGSKNAVYNDPAGIPTIGVGHKLTQSELNSGKIMINGVAVRYADTLTDQQVLALLAQDVAPAQDAVSNGVTVALNQNKFDALVSFTFNVGTGAFAGSTLLKVLNQGQYDQVPDQLRRWVHAGSKVLPGLVTRRENEIKLWNGEI